MTAPGVYCASTDALLRAGADPDALSWTGGTAVMLAARNGHRGCIDALARAGCTLDAVDEDGVSAWQYAKDGGYADCVDLLRRLQTQDAEIPRSPHATTRSADFAGRGALGAPAVDVSFSGCDD